ncbi:MAG: acyl carrier protein [Thermoanaerobaculia bacterium]
MTRDEILQIIGDVAREHLVGRPDPAGGERRRELAARLAGGSGGFGPSLRLAEDLALDSVQRLTLAVEVENRFRICLEPEDEEGIATVGDLASVVEGKLRDRQEAGGGRSG